MNVFIFLSATLLAGTCLFSGCKKEKSIVPENPSVVEITVNNSEGEVLENETVRMYDETSYESFKKKHAFRIETALPKAGTEDLVRITIPTGCIETYRNKWSDHPGYLKKIEERP